MKALIKILAITWLSLVCSVDCLYFHMKESSKKCFIEEIPDETMVIGEFEENN